MREQMNRHTEQYRQPENYSKQEGNSANKSGVGEYIDFEEIKD